MCVVATTVGLCLTALTTYLTWQAVGYNHALVYEREIMFCLWVVVSWKFKI